jgi:AcrR family transcriptional regulator
LLLPSYEGEVNRGRGVQQRSIDTRAALLDAALETLVERGYAATTTTEVARRAGVSRGAQLHHFPSKAELLTAAVGHLLERRVAEYRKVFANVDPGADVLDAAIDLLWPMFQGPTFVAWVELWIAARTDPALREAVVAMDDQFIEECDAIFAEVLADRGTVDDGLAHIGRAFAFALMDGMALWSLIPRDGGVPPETLIEALKFVARLAAPSSPEETP